MKEERYCLSCGHHLNAGEDHCPKCHFENGKETISQMEIHSFKRLCHGKLTDCREKKNKAFCFFVIAGISLILGIVFFFLSFRYNVLRVRVFTPASAEFVFSILFLALFLFSVIYACLNFFPSLSRKHYFEKLLREKK